MESSIPDSLNSEHFRLTQMHGTILMPCMPSRKIQRSGHNILNPTVGKKRCLGIFLPRAWRTLRGVL